MLDYHPEKSEEYPWISSLKSFIAKYRLSIRLAMRWTKRRTPVLINKIFPEEFIAPLFSTEWGKRASWAALGLFSFLLVMTLVQTALTWHEDYQIGSMQTMASSQSVDNNAAQLITHLPDDHLFGKIGVSDQGALPITSLQLRLLGVIKSNNENASRVIISEAGQAGKVYSIGDSLPSGITINAIADDGVILENGGHMEKLPLHRAQLTFQGMPKSLLNDESNT